MHMVVKQQRSNITNLRGYLTKMFTLLSALSARTLSVVNFTDCHSYYRRRIEIKQHSSLRMVPVWMTLVIYNPDFKVTIMQR